MMILDWQEYVKALPSQSAARPIIVESWGRSRDFGLSPSSAPRFRRVPDNELQTRLAAAAALIAAAAPHLQSISEVIAPIRHVVYLTDADGIVLSAYGDADLREQFRLVPGYDWSERAMGTNGAGTALSSGSCVAVVGREHYLSAFENCTCTGAAVRDATGAIVGAVDISTSVADGSPNRLALVAYGARMIERDLRVITEQSEVVRKEAAHEELERSRAFFLAMVAHEIRNPLAPIRTAAELLAKHLSHDVELSRLCNMITRNIEHAACLVNDLLDVTGAMHGRISATFRTVDAPTLILQVAESVQTIFDQRHQRFSVNVPRRAIAMEADPLRIVQIISNLLHNASKFTPAGGAVTIDLREEGDAVAVAVRDTGIGMTDGLRVKLFQPFVQAERGAHGGLGLGLFLARYLAALHQGEITATSDGPNRGSTFVLRLPKRVPST